MTKKFDALSFELEVGDIVLGMPEDIRKMEVRPYGKWGPTYTGPVTITLESNGNATGRPNGQWVKIDAPWWRRLLWWGIVQWWWRFSARGKEADDS